MMRCCGADDAVLKAKAAAAARAKGKAKGRDPRLAAALAEKKNSAASGGGKRISSKEFGKANYAAGSLWG